MALSSFPLAPFPLESPCPQTFLLPPPPQKVRPPLLTVSYLLCGITHNILLSGYAACTTGTTSITWLKSNLLVVLDMCIAMLETSTTSCKGREGKAKEDKQGSVLVLKYYFAQDMCRAMLGHIYHQLCIMGKEGREGKAKQNKSLLSTGTQTSIFTGEARTCLGHIHHQL